RAIDSLAAGGPLFDLLHEVRIAEIAWSDSFERDAVTLLELNPELLISAALRYEPAAAEAFWSALERAVRTDGVAMVQVHSGPEHRYRLIPRVAARLKAPLLRPR